MLIFCAVLVALLLYIERKGNPSATLALWIPTIYMLILGSRPVAQWFENTAIFNPSSVEAGSPLNRVVLTTLLVLALIILFGRKTECSRILRDNFALVSLYIFVGLSILWSDQMFLSFKRWVRLIEVIPIAMVVLSERAPLAALESIFRRCAYVLIPFSIILAKYYPNIGVHYGRWSGMLAWNGVTLTKNALAQLCLVSSFFIIWSFIRYWRMENVSKPIFRTLADGLIFVMAVYMLFGGPGGFSATSTANYLFIICCVILLYKMGKYSGQMATILICSVVTIWLLLIFSESFISTITPLLGRDETFTGRTDIWAMALRDAAPHPVLGTGFGSYFATDNEFSNTFGYTGHNGLLDIYVELGVVGVLILLGFLLSFYRKVRYVLDQSLDWGVFGICFLIISLLANFTESLFLKSSSYIWASMIFLIIVFSVSLNDFKENEVPIKNDFPPR
jgi:exopolysaccharide production protein ExoQ